MAVTVAGRLGRSTETHALGRGTLRSRASMTGAGAGAGGRSKGFVGHVRRVVGCKCRFGSLFGLRLDEEGLPSNKSRVGRPHQPEWMRVYMVRGVKHSDKEVARIPHTSTCHFLSRSTSDISHPPCRRCRSFFSSVSKPWATADKPYHTTVNSSACS